LDYKSESQRAVKEQNKNKLVCYLYDEPDDVADEKDDDDANQKFRRTLAGSALSLDRSAARRWNDQSNCRGSV
jgi:hypothetical protein